MIRNAHNSQHHTLDENEEAHMRLKDPRLSAVKTEPINATTPRRALGNIKNQMTPASGYKKQSLSKSARKTAPVLVFEDENDGDKLADSFEMMCAQTVTVLTPWSEIPPIEACNMAPLATPGFNPRSELNEETIRLHDADFDEFAEMCARTYVAPIPWTMEEVPPIETMPPIFEDEELSENSTIILERVSDDGEVIRLLEDSECDEASYYIALSEMNESPLDFY